MAVELLLPGRRVPAPKPPSRIALDMAFGVGNPAILGDKSRYRSHGTITGAVPAAGVHGYCLDFNPALPSYVEIPAAHTQLDFIAEDFSIIMRVRFSSLPAQSELLQRGLVNADGYYWHTLANGEVRFVTNQALANQWSGAGAGTVAALTWYTLGVSRTGNSVRLLRNGVDLTATVGVHIDPVTCARSAKIGIWDDLIANPLDARIEFLRVFRGIALQTTDHLAWHNALA